MLFLYIQSISLQFSWKQKKKAKSLVIFSKKKRTYISQMENAHQTKYTIHSLLYVFLYKNCFFFVSDATAKAMFLPDSVRMSTWIGFLYERPEIFASVKNAFIVSLQWTNYSSWKRKKNYNRHNKKTKHTITFYRWAECVLFVCIFPFTLTLYSFTEKKINSFE